MSCLVLVGRETLAVQWWEIVPQNLGSQRIRQRLVELASRGFQFLVSCHDASGCALRPAVRPVSSRFLLAFEADTAYRT